MKGLQIVHCVDTEGPLYESVDAIFGLLEKTFGLSYEPSLQKLEQLRRGEGLPAEFRDVVTAFLAPSRRSYKADWSQVDEMLNELMSTAWRTQFSDDRGRPYVFSWFVLDHVGFVTNPRRRALGYHSVFEHYRDKIRETGSVLDEIHWHFHPVPFFREANKTSNNFSNTNEHLQVLSRRVIDHLWFPICFRPGSHCERPDINLFLEQWVPFDYGNQGMPGDSDPGANMQKDIAAGRYGDWRRATTEWEIYHPDFYDYQKKGGMKRYIARCLNLNSRLRAIDENEIRRAFARARELPTILAVTNHDEREMRMDVRWFYDLVRKVQKESFPDVPIHNAGAVEALQAVGVLPQEQELKFSVSWEGDCMHVRTDLMPWGMQPFFCFKTLGNQYFHENLDYHGGSHWSFTFDDDTVRLGQLESIGLAANQERGSTTVARIAVRDRSIQQHSAKYGTLK